jgi:choline monooxygenase
MTFTLDPELSRAVMPPPAIYTDPAFAERERDRIFGGTWQLVARADQLAEDGDFSCAELAGHPIVLVRDGARLRGFHNVCRHRAGPVAAGCGRRKSLSCRYHGWTYGLDGRLRAAPEMDGVDGFAEGDHRLVPIEVGRRGPLVFAALAPATTLDDQLDGVRGLDPDLRFVMRRRYPVASNWKVYVDNYLEGYHIPVVHPELHRELDYDAYRTETARYWSRQHAPLRPVAGDDGDRSYRPEAGADAAYYWLFPNMMLNIYQGQLQTNLVVPVAVDRCEVVFDWFAPECPDDPLSDPSWARLIEMSELVQDQDAAICAAVQRGLSSPAAPRGRYSARRENGLHHFHSLLRDFLG